MSSMSSSNVCFSDSLVSKEEVEPRKGFASNSCGEESSVVSFTVAKWLAAPCCDEIHRMGSICAAQADRDRDQFV
jgi:hypothetical protein